MNKTDQSRADRLGRLLPVLKAQYPQARCRLNFKTPLELLIATILSAQCTDDRVNIVTKSLFRKCRSAAEYAAAPKGELEAEIQSTGFFRNKARSIRAMAQALIDRHGGDVPRTMEELTALAGVGRKTANVILGNAFGLNIGVTVDTHVMRLSKRLALSRHDDPVKIEQDLIRIVPRDDWTLFSHLLIAHGRAICQARKPRCAQCPLLADCPAGQKLIRAAELARSKALVAKPPARGPSPGRGLSNRS